MRSRTALLALALCVPGHAAETVRLTAAQGPMKLDGRLDESW
ncbi:MAG: hypothetical protein ACP5U2_02875 [Bryobacteraceae bacterium]